MQNKEVTNAPIKYMTVHNDALNGVVQDGHTLAVGGFGLCGIPEALIAALKDTGVKQPDLYFQ